MKNLFQIIKKTTSVIYYIALVVLILSNLTLWGQTNPVLSPLWGHLSLYVVIFCILLFIGSYVIKWIRRK
jgi:hypothetical protein